MAVISLFFSVSWIMLEDGNGTHVLMSLAKRTSRVT
jgi:hypothetical protein